MDMRKYLLAQKNYSPMTGLTLSDFYVNVYSVHKTTKDISHLAIDDAMDFEVTGSGVYGYYFADPDYWIYDYIIIVTYVGAEILDATCWVSGEGLTIKQQYTTIEEALRAVIT